MKSYHILAIKVLFLLFVPSILIAQDSNIKLLSYNVLHGFNADTVLMSRFVTWVKGYSPDILCLQELNGFDQDKLEKLAACYGHPYVAINTGVTHPIGITSRFPIVMVQKVTENMWHSYLYGNIEGLHIFVTHLSPFDMVSRRNDMRRIMAHIALLPKEEGIILAGDLNALAQTDKDAYDTALPDLRMIEGRLEPKSGLPIVKGRIIYRHNLDNGKLDYTVTSMPLKNGMYDAVSKMNGTFVSSVPTHLYQKENSHLLRIDYVFVNEILGDCLKQAEIIKDSVTDSLSDHYPVWVEMQKPK